MKRPAERLLTRIMPPGGLAFNVVTLAGGSALGNALAFLASPFLTRLYTPADFGVLTAYISLVALIAIVVSLRYERAIPLPDDEEVAANLLVLSLLVAIALSLLSALFLWLAGDTLTRLLNVPILLPYLWLLPLSLLAIGTFQIFTMWAIRKQAYTRVARVNLIQKVGMVVVQLAAGLLHFHPIGLLLGDLTGRASGTSTLALAGWQEDKAAFKRVSWAGIVAAASQYRDFPLLSSGAAALNSAGQQLPLLLIVGYFGSEVGGWLGLVQRSVAMPLALIGQAVAHVYVGEVAQRLQSEPDRVYPLFAKLLVRLGGLGLLPMIALGAAGPWMSSLFFGAQWLEAGIYARLLAPRVFTQFMVFPLSQTFNLIERQGIQLAWDASRLVALLTILLASPRLEFPPRLTIGLYGACMVLFDVVYLLLAAYHLRALSKKAGE